MNRLIIASGMSTYAPAWVKMNPKRFPRMKLRKAGGVLQTTEILSIFHEEAQKCDARAFKQLMRHLKDFDQNHSTVIMVQVENETGLLGDSRDGSAAAEERFSKPVPDDLLDFLANDWDSLHRDLKRNLVRFKAQTNRQGSWAEVFGKGPHTDELFMAYHYALYVNQVAAAGREEYPLPLYTNAWQNYAGEDIDNNLLGIVGGGGMPGDYPSGGCTTNVLDIWQRFAPSLDFFTPDIYLNDYESAAPSTAIAASPCSFPNNAETSMGPAAAGLQLALTGPLVSLRLPSIPWTPNKIHTSSIMPYYNRFPR